MTTRVEQSLYHHVALAFRAEAAVYEVGCWLGGSTLRICEGLDVAGGDWLLNVVDRFEWSASYERKGKIGMSDGDSFLPVFQDNLARFGSRVRPIPATIAELESLGIPEGPVELLFVDAPKSWKTMAQLLRAFGPHLVQGGSVLFQDFLHIPSHETVWLLFSLAELTPWLIASHGCSAVFRVKAPISKEHPSLNVDLRDAPLDDLMNAWRTARGSVPAEYRWGLHLAFGGVLWDRGCIEEAQGHLNEVSFPRSFAIEATKQLRAAVGGGARVRAARMYEYMLSHVSQT
jgi:hypothetical protein